jgi:hypothetical protein
MKGNDTVDFTNEASLRVPASGGDNGKASYMDNVTRLSLVL